jgi:hypothetical protein
MHADANAIRFAWISYGPSAHTLKQQPWKREGSRMRDLVDIVIPAGAQAAARSLGLEVTRSVTAGVRIRRISRDRAEIAVECLRDWGFLARITEPSPEDDPRSPEIKRAA